MGVKIPFRLKNGYMPTHNGCVVSDLAQTHLEHINLYLQCSKIVATTAETYNAPPNTIVFQGREG